MTQSVPFRIGRVKDKSELGYHHCHLCFIFLNYAFLEWTGKRGVTKAQHKHKLHKKHNINK